MVAGAGREGRCRPPAGQGGMLAQRLDELADPATERSTMSGSAYVRWHESVTPHSGPLRRLPARGSPRRGTPRRRLLRPISDAVAARTGPRPGSLPLRSLCKAWKGTRPRHCRPVRHRVGAVPSRSRVLNWPAQRVSALARRTSRRTATLPRPASRSTGLLFTQPTASATRPDTEASLRA